MQPSRNDPETWAQFAPQLHPGSELDGTVTTVVNFGAFVEVAPGIEGLVHTSESSRPLVSGERVHVRVLAKDDESRRLSFRAE